MVGGANPGHVVLGSIRNQTEQAMISMSINSTSPRPLYQVLPSDFLCLDFLQ